VRLLLISDSCHSGTVTRAAAADPDADDAPRPRFMPMGNWLAADKLPHGISGQPLTTVPVTAGLLAFCRRAVANDGRPAAGRLQGRAEQLQLRRAHRGRPCGAFTYYALKALKQLPANATYAIGTRRSIPATCRRHRIRRARRSLAARMRASARSSPEEGPGRCAGVASMPGVLLTRGTDWLSPTDGKQNQVVHNIDSQL
jgi:hypothetical protein